MLKIKNSETSELVEINENKVSIYNCGPTVYNHVHIGNIRPAITFDVLYRLLKYTKHDVIYVHNITDIDDKIINRAIETKQNELELSNYYYETYLDLLNKMNILKMDVIPKVSENIEGIINFVKTLVDKNNAYVVDGDVYFDINKIKNYGCVSHQNTENLLEGVRKEVDTKKHNPLDFVLWKKTEIGINWKSPWNDHGRPGWHTECVYLINKFIGKQVTIHGGGVDLKFPHHENENAQNEAFNNMPLAKCWMHVGHININGQKMSKSLNNFILAKDILEQYDHNAIRWFFFQTKYANPLNYSKENMDSSKNDINKIFNSLNLAYINLHKNGISINKTANIDDFINVIENDLDLPNSVKIIWEKVKLLSTLANKKQWNDLSQVVVDINEIFKVLGLTYSNPLNDQETLALVDRWNQAVKEKNYSLADEYRKQLIDKKII